MRPETLIRLVGRLFACVGAIVVAFPCAALDASYMDGTLVLRGGGASGPVVGVARWTVDEVPEGSHLYRVGSPGTELEFAL